MRRRYTRNTQRTARFPIMLLGDTHPFRWECGRAFLFSLCSRVSFFFLMWRTTPPFLFFHRVISSVLCISTTQVWERIHWFCGARLRIFDGHTEDTTLRFTAHTRYSHVQACPCMRRQWAIPKCNTRYLCLPLMWIPQSRPCHHGLSDSCGAGKEAPLCVCACDFFLRFLFVLLFLFCLYKGRRRGEEWKRGAGLDWKMKMCISSTPWCELLLTIQGRRTHCAGIAHCIRRTVGRDGRGKGKGWLLREARIVHLIRKGRRDNTGGGGDWWEWARRWTR